LNYEQEPSFRDLLNLIKQGLAITLALALLASAATYFLSQQIQPTYQAGSVIVAAQTNSNDNRFNVSLATATPLDASAYAAAAKSSPVTASALTALGETNITVETITALRNSLSVSTEDDRSSSLIRLTVKDDSAESAAAKANALAQALINWDKARATEDLETIIVTLESQLAALDAQIRVQQGMPESEELAANLTLRGQQAQQLNYAQTLRTSAIGLLKLLEPAYPALSPIAPNPIRNAALAFILTVLLSYGLILLRDSLNTQFKDSDEVARLSGLPILAEFPKLPAGARRLPSEASSYLRTNLSFSLPDNKTRTILVTSALSSEGKSSVALSLAESYARNGYDTLLIDADLRKPIIAKEYNLNGDRHSNFSLEQHLFANKETKIIRVNLNNEFGLHVLPSFKSSESPSEVLSQFQDLLTTMREKFEVIIVDSAPLLPVADTLTIAPLCSGTLLVTGMLETDKKSVTKALDLLNRLGIKILGIAATQLTKQSRGNSKYGYGYGYGYGEDEAKVTPVKSKKNLTAAKS